MRFYATDLIRSTGVSGFQILNSCFAYILKLRLHAEILSYGVMTSLFPEANLLGSSRSVLNVSNGGP